MHRENLNPKFFMGGQPFQRKSRCRIDLTFTVIHLREKLSRLSSHSGNLISETGLFLNCARDKYIVLEMDVWSFRCLSRVCCQTGTESRI